MADDLKSWPVIAKYAGYSRRHMVRLAKKYGMPYKRQLNGWPRIKVQELEKWLRKHTIERG